MRSEYTTREFTMRSDKMGREVNVRIEGEPGFEQFMVEVSDGVWEDAYMKGHLSWSDFMEAEKLASEPPDTCHHGN